MERTAKDSEHTGSSRSQVTAMFTEAKEAMAKEHSQQQEEDKEEEEEDKEQEEGTIWEVANCSPTYRGSMDDPSILWEKCIVLSDMSRSVAVVKVDVQITSDGTQCNNIPVKFLRQTAATAKATNTKTSSTTTSPVRKKMRLSKKEEKKEKKNNFICGTNPWNLLADGFNAKFSSLHPETSQPLALKPLSTYPEIVPILLRGRNVCKDEYKALMKLNNGLDENGDNVERHETPNCHCQSVECCSAHLDVLDAILNKCRCRCKPDGRKRSYPWYYTFDWRRRRVEDGCSSSHLTQGPVCCRNEEIEWCTLCLSTTGRRSTCECGDDRDTGFGNHTSESERRMFLHTEDKGHRMLLQLRQDRTKVRRRTNRKFKRGGARKSSSDSTPVAGTIRHSPGAEEIGVNEVEGVIAEIQRKLPGWYEKY